MNKRLLWIFAVAVLWLLDRPSVQDTIAGDGTKVGWLAGKLDVVSQAVAEKIIHWFVGAGQAFFD